MRARQTEVIVAVTSVWMAVLQNVPFWTRVHRAVEPVVLSDWLFIAVIGIVIIALNFMVLMAIAHRPLFRVVMAVILPLNAAASYFMLTYGVVIDDAMVRNVVETNTGEAGDLISGAMLAYIALLGVLPAIVVWIVPWQPRPLRARVRAGLKSAGMMTVVMAALIVPFAGHTLSTFREHKELRLSLAPANVLFSSLKYLRQARRAAVMPVATYGEDAVKSSGDRDSGRARLFVIVVGETARAQQFGLNGYPRDTTPELAAINGLINFPNATSCGTDTAHSVPCMFSGIGRARFSNVAAETRENLLDILKRADFDVVWRDNQSGCKGVCKRVTNEAVVDHASGAHGKIESHDEVLLDGLSERIATLGRDTVIVLHMMGSHGPAYWKRVPDAYRVFKPECEDTDLGRCSPEHLVNAYDNTIRYTDHVLARLVAILDGAGKHNVDAAMMYVSDHGESLGEYDLYLHGMPYALAPSVQTHVPMMTWVSPSWRTRLKLETTCMTTAAKQPVSHDNVFHSVLGVLDVATKVYDPALDLYRACRSAQGAAKAQ